MKILSTAPMLYGVKRVWRRRFACRRALAAALCENAGFPLVSSALQPLANSHKLVALGSQGSPEAASRPARLRKSLDPASRRTGHD